MVGTHFCGSIAFLNVRENARVLVLAVKILSGKSFGGESFSSKKIFIT